MLSPSKRRLERETAFPLLVIPFLSFFTLLSSVPIYLLLYIGKSLEEIHPLVGRGFLLLANAASLIGRFQILREGEVIQVHSHLLGENKSGERWRMYVVQSKVKQ